MEAIISVDSSCYVLRRGENALNCDECAYYEYDEEDEAYYCSVDMDEDDYARLVSNGQLGHTSCPYYRNGDEYAVVRHQM